MNRPRPVCALVVGLMTFLAAARGQSPLLPPQTSSASGQFIVSLTPASQPYFRRADAGTNTEFIRLEPSLLAVSAERFKLALWRQIGLAPNTPWHGKIFLALHEARSTDETVFIAAEPFLRNWNYRLELPNLVARNRCARALSSVLLLEIANRHTPVGDASAVIPDWLVDGLAREILQSAETGVILSAPAKALNTIPQTRLDEKRHGLDPLAGVRSVLQKFPALTFQQLSWPTGAQMNGDDGGVYLASAQLFVHDLLALENGPARVRTLLAELSAHANWQSAFLAAFHENFRRPLDVEKWWALRVVAFAARAPGPQWTPTVSCDRLNAVLAVPVNIRYTSNSLPEYAEISLQTAMKNFSSDQQMDILQTRLRDLQLVQFRLTPALAPVADGYRQVLADYLSGRKKSRSFRQPDAAAAIRQLDVLDARRRDDEAKIKSAALTSALPGNAP
jgi:hypothetical protein